MPSGQGVYAGNAVDSLVLAAGLRGDFWETYSRTYEGLKPFLGEFMQLDVPSDKLAEIYGYFGAAPYHSRWPRGEAMRTKAFKGFQWTVANKDYALRVDWHKNDRADDQTKSLYQRAQEVGSNFATMDERVLIQLCTGATDIELLESLPNAPDGVGLYSATDGDGAARFGISGGNIVTGTGIATSEAIRVDLFTAIVRAMGFKDTENQPLFDASTILKGITILFGAANFKIFNEAFKQMFTVQSSVAPTNIILDAAINVTLRPNPRITDNDWFVFFNGVPRKPIFSQKRQEIREFFADMSNSDYCRDTGMEYLQWDCRRGYGIALPFATVKVNN
jgi:hypothetical protein